MCHFQVYLEGTEGFEHDGHELGKVRQQLRGAGHLDQSGEGVDAEGHHVGCRIRDA